MRKSSINSTIQRPNTDIDTPEGMVKVVFPDSNVHFKLKSERNGFETKENQRQYNDWMDPCKTQMPGGVGIIVEKGNNDAHELDVPHTELHIGVNQTVKKSILNRFFQKCRYAMLGKISVRNFKPKTVKKGKENTTRKRELRDAFDSQNENLCELQDRCKNKKLSIDITFYLNEKTADKASYKKDLDNLIKILMDVIKEEMDDNDKKPGLGLVIKNKDEEIFEIICHKEFVDTDNDEGIDLVISEWEK